MWRILGLKVWVTVFVGILLVAAALVYRGRYGDDPTTATQLAASAFAGIGLAMPVMYGLGRWAGGWALSCRLFGKLLQIDDLNGTWEGQSRSNFDYGEERGDDPLKIRPLRMTITQNWLAMTVVTTRPAAATRAESRIVLVRKTEQGPRYTFVFDARDDAPPKGGATRWFGASDFWFDRQTGKLRGQYCSNRDYQNGQPTAGDFVLSRVQTEET